MKKVFIPESFGYDINHISVQIYQPKVKLFEHNIWFKYRYRNEERYKMLMKNESRLSTFLRLFENNA